MIFLIAILFIEPLKVSRDCFFFQTFYSYLCCFCLASLHFLIYTGSVRYSRKHLQQAIHERQPNLMLHGICQNLTFHFSFKCIKSLIIAVYNLI